MTVKDRTTNNDVYDMMTQAIVAKLKSGVVPWRQPWSSDYPHRFPTNLKSMKAYRGLNVMMLMSQGYDSPYWLSFKQAKELGGTVNAGERSTPITFWKTGNKVRDEETGEERKILLLRYYRVFNVEQCSGLKMPKRAVLPEEKPAGSVKESDSILEASVIIDRYTKEFGGPPIKHTGDRACYSPDLDQIRMPAKKKFHSLAGYYSTLFHEAVHSTGHHTRLARELKGMMEIESYSKEELVAEMGAHFLMMEAGIQCDQVEENTAAYLKCWIKKLNDDVKFVVNAASIAQKAVDHILNRTWDDARPVDDTGTDE